MTKWQDLQDIVDGTKKRRDVKKKAGAAVAVGTVVGGVAGVLLAPKSGKETRAKLISKTKSGTHKVEDVSEAVKDKAQDVAKETKAAAEKTKKAATAGKDAVKRSAKETDTKSRS